MTSAAPAHADFQDWAWCLAFLVVYSVHPTPEGIARAWAEADEARTRYVERESLARSRFGAPRPKKEPVPLPSGKPGVKRRKRTK